MPDRLLSRVRRLATAAGFSLLALAGMGWAVAGGLSASASASQPLPALDGATAWINSTQLDAQALRGKVVLVDFWTYSCINCLRTLPYVKAWAQKYEPYGLVVIGAHTPEFEFERSTANVARAVRELGITYPVAVDSHQALWRAFGTTAWPTFYFVDADGRVRSRQLGEGRYDDAEHMIQQLLREAGRHGVPTDLVAPHATGTQAAPGARPAASGETYLGGARAEGFVSARGALAGPGPGPGSNDYAPAPRLDLDQWTLAGRWRVAPDLIELAAAGGRIAYRFQARDVHLVLGPDQPGHAIRFRVRVDGRAPGADHGDDIDADGAGTVDAKKLYQLVRQAHDDGHQHLVEIEFLDAGAQAYAFTFG